MARESLLSILRLTSFHQAGGEGKKATAALRQEAKTLQRDATALADHAAYLSNKINFLLDATLGLINLEQNQIIKIFTVAAVAFLPPTLVASVYGMNFDFMPELKWDLGYPLAIVDHGRLGDSAVRLLQAARLAVTGRSLESKGPPWRASSFDRWLARSADDAQVRELGSDLLEFFQERAAGRREVEFHVACRCRPW